jgi:uncharacterized protein YegJ (DUF2314 family)
MKTRLILSSILCLALILCSCSRDPETLVRDGYDEQEMEAAIKDRGETEHFWLTDVTYRDGSFEGLIGNDPGIVTNVKFGQKWTLKKVEISDWMFMRDEKMHGNYTLRPLLRTMRKEDAEMWRSRFAEP